MLRRFLKGLIGTPALELRPIMEAIQAGTQLPKQVLTATLNELKRSRKQDSRTAPPAPKGRAVIDYVTNRTSIAGLFDAILKAVRPLDRFFRTEEDIVFVRIGIGPAPVSERNLPGFLSAFVEIRFLSEDDEAQSFQRYGVLPSELARAFANDPRVRSKLPPLANYARSPLFTVDWAFVATPGYHRHGGGIFYDGPEVKPAEAGTPHLDEVLAGFCFKEDADRVNFIGVMLTALTMPHWGRGHPFLAINGNKPGVGKSTLARVLGVIVEGREPTTVTWVPDDTEFEKQIATRVEAGDHVIVVDNAKTSRAIQSAVLERCITDSRPNFRRLGSNTSISRAQNDLLFCLTMNMTQLGRDLRRRALPVNLYLEEDVRLVDYPLDDVVGFAIEHRLELVAELSGMVLRWRDGGAQVPEQTARHSTSRAWARTLDAILWFSGRDGFLTNFEASMHAFDPEFDRMQEICAAHHSQPPSTAGEWAERLKETLMEDRFKTVPATSRRRGPWPPSWAPSSRPTWTPASRSMANASAWCRATRGGRATRRSTTSRRRHSPRIEAPCDPTGVQSLPHHRPRQDRDAVASIEVHTRRGGCYHGTTVHRVSGPGAVDGGSSRPGRRGLQCILLASRLAAPSRSLPWVG